MLYNYIALLLFIAFAVFVPASFLLTVKLLGDRNKGNPVKNAPYESGEETIGDSRDVDNEYLPHFMIFLPFELMIVILLLWSTVTKDISFNTSVSILVLGVIATAFAVVGYKMIND
jgi:NADH:ubiquinone oxidoreductase subunit 3 (subunit A)